MRARRLRFANVLLVISVPKWSVSVGVLHPVVHHTKFHDTAYFIVVVEPVVQCTQSAWSQDRCTASYLVCTENKTGCLERLTERDGCTLSGGTHKLHETCRTPE